MYTVLDPFDQFTEVASSLAPAVPPVKRGTSAFAHDCDPAIPVKEHAASYTHTKIADMEACDEPGHS